MVRSTDGKARVSVAWLVVVGMLFLAALVMAYFAQTDLNAERKLNGDKEVALKTENDQLEGERKLRRDISLQLGWYLRTDLADPKSSPDGAKKALDDLRTTFPDMGASDKDFETAIPRILTAVTERDRQIGDLQSKIKSLESERDAAKKATTDVTTEKDGTINGLRQERRACHRSKWKYCAGVVG